MAELNNLLGYMSDAQRRRQGGEMAASAYDVQTPGPGVMDSLGLLGFLLPGTGLLGRGVEKSAEFAGQLGAAAAKGPDWARAHMFERFAPNANHVFAGEHFVNPARQTQASMGEWMGMPTHSYASRIDELGEGYTGAHKQFYSMLDNWKEIGSPNEFSNRLAPQTQNYLNALLAQRAREGFNVIPGGK